LLEFGLKQIISYTSERVIRKIDFSMRKTESYENIIVSTRKELSSSAPIKTNENH
jgi:hypothetical protein